ncbi:MAG: restriction endonuclease subunit S [Clostridia bacterium]|nr:restriction endonuclease subunit S [Clostridia bacterium]
METKSYSLEKIAHGFSYGSMPRDELMCEFGYPIFSGYRYTGYYKEFNIKKRSLVIIARGVGGTGEARIAEEKTFLTNLAIAIDIDDSLADIDYLKYYLNLQGLRYLDSGAAQSQITINSLKRHKVFLPSINEQKSIISILSAYDNLIEVNNKRIKILEQIAENLYKEWFVRFRFPGHEAAEFENGIPKGWITKPLNEWMVESFNGGWGEEIAIPKMPNEAAVIRGTDIEDVKASRYCDVPLRYHKENDIKTKLLKENDIILELSNGNINNIGRTLYITKEILSHFDKVICASFCKTLRFSDVRVAFFVWQYIEYLQNSGIMFFYKNTGANGINNFNFKRFLRMPISIPNDMEIVEKMMCFHNEISAIREKNFNLIKQRDLLLPRLMNGKLETNDDKLKTISIKTKLSYNEFISEMGMAARASQISESDLKAMYDAYIDDDATE